jgi:predicted MFS family arabinose efflux permease
MVNINRQLNNPFAALRHRNFRYYWLGMCISLIGTWMQNIAQPWLAYSLTQSPFLLSLVSALQFTPMLLFSLFAGVWVDRLPKKRILFFTQSASMLITLALAILVATGWVRYWHILVAATTLGMVNTLDMPTRQSFVIELVGKEDLMNAIALNSSVFNLARIVGPALAGLVMAWAGVAACFFANAVSFAAVIFGLSLIKPLTVYRSSQRQRRIWSEIRDGLAYIRREPLLLRTLLIMAVVGTFAMNYNVLVPVFVKLVLKQQAKGFSFLMSFMGLGSFLGALLVAALSKSGPQKLVLNVIPFFIALFLILIGCTNRFVLTGLGLAISGLCFITFSSTANSRMQLNTRDEYRGRVMSIYTLVFGGLTPVGNLYAGLIADRFGPRTGFWASGAIIILLCGLLLVWDLKTRVRDRRTVDK